MRQPDFEQCKQNYMSNRTAQQYYGWTGKVIGIQPNNYSQISTAGCRDLCGTGSDYYPWSLASSTITTWILPIIGILLQAPFESNAFWRTVLAIARWVGSPMASLAYILWNIKVSAKCALMVDMATRCDEDITNQDSHFASIRDSFYILTTMNQYTMRRSEALNKEAEGLLRIVLFSKDIQLRGKDGKEKRLNEVRQNLARRFRAARRRGVVPVFVSTGWFLFSIGISIQASFGQLGQNATAHDLALGLLLAWLPVLILCSIVDRNPVAAEDIRRKLNKLVDTVCRSLQDDEIREEFIDTFEGQPESERKRMEAWVRQISRQSEYMQDFFVYFAGQGRVRWHYGAAHPILSDIEKSYVTAHGRGWLANEAEARTHLVLGTVDEGLLWFDFRELWQICSAVLIVGGTCFGAFILSYYTPTVGLGCRSGGYVIFCIISFSQLVFELLVWWFASPVRPEQPHWVRRSITHVQQKHMVIKMEERAHDMLQRFARAGKNLLSRSFSRLLDVLPFPPRFKANVKSSLKHQAQTRRDWTFQQWTEHCFFRPMEILNSTWLLYIVLAQTFGSYRTCDCMTSTWGSSGGYMDFLQSDLTTSPWVRWYWSAGTAAGTLIMALGMAYVVGEWCQQSHLSTDDYAAACRGLRRTRAYRRWTYRPFRVVARAVLFLGRGGRGSSSLHWLPDGRGYRQARRGEGRGGAVMGAPGEIAMAPTTPPRVGPLGVTPSIQLQEWVDAGPYGERRGGGGGGRQRYRSVSLDTFDEDGFYYDQHRHHRGVSIASSSTPTNTTVEFSPPYFPGSRGVRSRSRSRGESDASTKGLLAGGAGQRPDDVVVGVRDDEVARGSWGDEMRSALESASQVGSALGAEERGEGREEAVLPPPPPAARRSVELLGVGEGVAGGLGLRPAYVRMGTDEAGREAK
ncbi:Glutamine-dependent nad(+) synthetase protein [Lasiodiplodia theobromae]|uniref:Glutamine-dependent nad(+) synthetase protein n=1 Tax=Lasiodiplodia theobromae TaxID=45133 RepID=UPI0015C3B300|nr:Glutamine-dependent nad(+) synthetase protein [Lasiodiplodia theobromae]KAF4534903.1 Glutamine-dependent nad(+) synthetase protein [Lasiodiplodia theobromae]